MKGIVRTRNLVMLGLSIAMTPMQYAFAQGIDTQTNHLKALAAASASIQQAKTQAQNYRPATWCGPGNEQSVPTPKLGAQAVPMATPPRDTDPCFPQNGTPVPSHNPTTPSAPTGPAFTKYYLLPGIGDKNPSGNLSQYFNGSSLPGFINQSGNKGISVQEMAPFADWKSIGIAAQGNALNSDITTTTRSTDSVILIGHSMGGLRARAALQYGNNSTPTQVKALVTLGTPNLGAPIIDKGLPAAGHLGAVLGGVFGAFRAVPILISVGAGMFGLREVFKPTINGPSGQDMRPSGNFITTLNNSSKAIPGNVVVADVVGLNNNLDAYAASNNVLGMNNSGTVYNTRMTVGKTLAVLSAAAFVAAFWTFGATIPWGIALAAAAYLVLNLPTWWRNNVVGSGSGDSVVPEANQYIPASAGGDRSVGTTRLNTATHTGRYGEYQTNNDGEYTDGPYLQRALQSVQIKAGVPQS